MKLHEAIEKLIRQTGRPMTTSEIATELNRLKWYQKRDGSNIQAFQIYGRSKNYVDLFKVDGSTISLISTRPYWEPDTGNIAVQKLSDISNNHELLEKVLMNEKNFKNLTVIEQKAPDEPGIYCIRVQERTCLPETFAVELGFRKHNILYIGQASKSLRARVLKQELQAKGHGTFFRSMGAALGYKPKPGSLSNMINKKNYKFEPMYQTEIINWIEDNLIVNWVKMTDELSEFETYLIKKYNPLFNITNSPSPFKPLESLTEECRKIANEVI